MSEEYVQSNENAQSDIPKQWRIEQVQDGVVAFDCPDCREHHDFDSVKFEDTPTEHIEGLTKTEQFVRRNFGQQFLSIVVALIVYYYAHRWVNGPDAPLNQGILIPVFIAVVAHAVVKPLFSAGLFSGKGISIYAYECPACYADIFISTDGKRIALPVSSSEDNEEAESSPEEETEANEEEA